MTVIAPRPEPTRPDSPYRSYVYAYPHKSAYRPLPQPPALADVWRGEDVGALSLYTHIPFCEMRCGFCNLFTRSTPPAEQVSAYLDALERQAETVAAALPDGAAFARAALGGGTPTYLTAEELVRVYDLTERAFGVDLSAIPVSVETSPATATPDRLAVLAERGVTRLSIGVQSFLDAEAHAAGRPQKRAEVDRALNAIREHTRAGLNVDLIYGIDRQDARTWAYSLDTALGWEPEEVYLYPLYVRPLTGLGRRAREWDDHRLDLYRQGRDHLRERGYEQVSMRMFRRVGAPEAQGPDHCCQTDGMVGLGCGARSYTSATHYSFDYAVGVGHVRSIIADFVGRDVAGLSRAEVGYRLDEGERRRRHVLQSLLRTEGLDTDAYADRFGARPEADFPGEFAELAERGWLPRGGAAASVRLTEEGLAHSDAIGPLFFSPEVVALMADYEAR
ncbi:oxygen-independent coproporphyrinogen-3 oxidase [Nocardiopsis sp. Huas11]|uniref:STM4012 family radical SAM protein n=1 Tax=Nocardiopsis sp. Huas11 TaxID=2183912 RepID=UPI000EAEFE32|nr:STM4012 family radical SAM protein [Nocardiopsis sp. Huas11]RKS05732.1 oxygen-independent coproporphyrinogen-3 oxidase [Nocardiopsis sp. Huas11]